MIRLPSFTYLRPHELGEACAMLAEHGPDAVVVAGGTDLYPNMKRRQVEPKVLVGLSRMPELRGVHANGGLVVGAATTLGELAAHPAVLERYPALARAAALVSSPQIRNAATAGGNLCVDTRCNYYDLPEGWRAAAGFCLKAGSDACRLAPGGERCWAISSSDLAPVAVALDASVRLVGAAGERIVPVADLYRDDGVDYLAKAPGEILAELRFPPADGLRATYRKLRRRGSIDFPILGVAAAVRLDGDGRCTEARIVLGAVASHPVRATDAERILVGSRLTPEAIEEAAEAAARPAKPMENADLTPLYRKRMARVYVARALAELGGVA
jgi:4-hydroxybenzoyl-CoA reductase subunit beta